jgi:CheY-like chemotaxis protein
MTWELAIEMRGNSSMHAETVGRPMEILLIEDSLFYARFTIEALKKGGIQHRLTLIFDGEEALEFIHRNGKFANAPRPDLILLDLQLPRKSGLEVLEDLRASYDLQSIPVVVMTSSESLADMQECERLGVESYITKPVDLQKFLAVVKELKNCWRDDLLLPALD